jgi:hypothetical protein
MFMTLKTTKDQFLIGKSGSGLQHQTENGTRLPQLARSTVREHAGEQTAGHGRDNNREPLLPQNEARTRELQR